MKVTEKTRAVAQQALDYIVEHPERHNQASFFDYEGYDSVGGLRYTGGASLCDTTMCVAGTVQWQQEGYIDLIDVEQYAERALGLTEEEAYSLFFDAGNERAVDMLRAIANGDEAKFEALSEE